MSSPKSDATQQAMRAKVASKLAETLVSASSSSDVDVDHRVDLFEWRALLQPSSEEE